LLSQPIVSGHLFYIVLDLQHLLFEIRTLDGDAFIRLAESFRRRGRVVIIEETLVSAEVVDD
jgi:hypothetical protein